MKGFAVTPLVFLIVFIIVISLSFHVRSVDSQATRSLAAEGEARKAMLEAQKEMTKAASIALETLYSENRINELQDMEDKIHSNLLAAGIDATVLLEAGGPKLTQVNITPNNFQAKRSTATVTLNSTYSFLVGHPFYQYYANYSSYDPSEVCAYAAACDFTNYPAAKLAATDLTWAITVNSCADPGDGSRVVDFSISVKDQDNYLTQPKPFQLDDRNSKGSWKFNVKC